MSVVALTVHNFLGACCTLAGGGTAVYGLRNLSMAWASDEWPTVWGKVLDAGVQTSSDGDGTTYAPRIRFAYEVGGESYSGDRLSFGGPLYTSWRSAAESTAERYRVGSDCRVYYDPGRPDRACLEPGARWYAYLVPLMGAVFVAVGILTLMSKVAWG